MSKKSTDPRREENLNRITYRLVRKAIDRHPDKANLTAISKAIGSTTQKIWFYVRGYAKWPAEDFLGVMASLGMIKRSRGEIWLRLPCTEKEAKELMKLAKIDFKPTRSSSIAGAFERA